ncbi:MAG TPA: PocR ligand-binding domain-containing protein, partial [Leptolinea sp.]
NLPIHCLQTIQDLFSVVSQFSAVLISPQGELITEISNPCRFCQLFCDNLSSSAACHASQMDFAQQAKSGAQRFTCHAGLNYVGTYVLLGKEPIGLFLVGGYMLDSNKQEKTEVLLNQYAAKYTIPTQQLKTAFDQVTILPADLEDKLETWATVTAKAFQSILQERSGFALRLKKIADLTQIP